MLAKVAYYSYQVRGPSHRIVAPSPHLHIAAANASFPSAMRTSCRMYRNLTHSAFPRLLSIFTRLCAALQSYLPPRMGSSSDMPDPWGAAWFGLSNGAAVSGRQLPIGVLFQHMCPADVQPLQLTVHFSQRYPDDACPFIATSRHKQHLIFNPRHMYFNNLKEALMIQTGADPPSIANRPSSSSPMPRSSVLLPCIPAAPH